MKTKFLIVLLVCLISSSCNQLFEPDGVYYNENGEKLILKKSKNYTAFLYNQTIKGTWKSIPSKNKILIYNWKDSNGNLTNKMVTLRKNMLWFSADNHSKNFFKEKK